MSARAKRFTTRKTIPPVFRIIDATGIRESLPVRVQERRRAWAEEESLPGSAGQACHHRIPYLLAIAYCCRETD